MMMFQRWPKFQSWSATIFEQNEIHEKSSCSYRTMNWHSTTFSFFRFLSFDLKFLKPIGYTVCIPTTGRRLMAITWAAGEFSTNEKQEPKRNSRRSKKMPCQTNPFFLTFFRLFQSPLFLFNFKLLIFEHFWTFLTRFISLKNPQAFFVAFAPSLFIKIGHFHPKL